MWGPTALKLLLVVGIKTMPLYCDKDIVVLLGPACHEYSNLRKGLTSVPSGVGIKDAVIPPGRGNGRGSGAG